MDFPLCKNDFYINLPRKYQVMSGTKIIAEMKEYGAAEDARQVRENMDGAAGAGDISAFKQFLQAEQRKFQPLLRQHLLRQSHPFLIELFYVEQNQMLNKT